MANSSCKKQEMDTPSPGDVFLHLWQKRNFEAESGDTKTKADALRFNLSQLQYLKNSFSDINDAAVSAKTRELLQDYSKLMDDQDKGLNNYAEPILTLVGKNKNNSKKWKCNLDPQKIIDKYVKPLPDPKVTLKGECKKLAEIMNKSEKRKPLKKLDSTASQSAKSVASGGNVMPHENVELSFNLMDDDMMDDQDINSACGFQQQAQTMNNRESFSGGGFRGQNFNKSSFPPRGGHSGVSAGTFRRETSESRSVSNNHVGRGGIYPWNRGNLSGSFGGGRGNRFGKENMESRFGNDTCNMSSAGSNTERGRQDGWRGSWRGHSSGNPFTTYQHDTSGSENRGRGRGRGRQYPWSETVKQDEDADNQDGSSCFRTASHQLLMEQMKKNGRGPVNEASYGTMKRSLGIRRAVNNKFTPPVRREEEDNNYGSGEIIRRCLPQGSSGRGAGGGGGNAGAEDSPYAELMTDERLKNIEPKMVELIMNEIMDSGPPVSWDDIAGLELAKTTIQEIVVWPMLRPDIFTGLRGPPKGILLFGPPGTGKTMIGKCIASQSGSTFFSISASSLTSKWVGEGEKMVRAMFAVARCHQPAVIFIDEIDSLLTQRSDTEHESSRRIKTEFLVQLDGATSGGEERLLVVGATNRPQELDEAARRRLVKRLYIPLPESKARQQIIENLMGNQRHSLSEQNITNICQKTDGYSGADMANLCREAALGPIRSINFNDIQHISVDQVRPISSDDFISALCSIRASVSDKDLQMYEEWNKKYGIASR